MRQIYVESGVRMAASDGAAVWCFDLDLWGVCVQARTADDAVAAWESTHGAAKVVETIVGDEGAFDRDRRPASATEAAATAEILARQRLRALRILGSLPTEVLERDDPRRELPDWARWRTISQTLWHITDAESRYYLPALGLPGRERQATLAAELEASLAHVLLALARLDPRAHRESGGEVWTATKVLRRLAWHERGELDAIDDLLRGWGLAVPGEG